MSTQAITPNWHVLLIHLPIGLLMMGLLIELFSFLWRRSSARPAGRWMILLGTLSAVPALTTGLYAFRETISHQAGQTLHQLGEISKLSGEQWQFLRRHIFFNAIGTGALALMVVMWLGSSDAWRKRLYVLHLLLLVGGMGCLSIGAWNGGEGVYRYGTAVEGPPGAGVEPKNLDNPAEAPGQPAGEAAATPATSADAAKVDAGKAEAGTAGASADSAAKVTASAAAPAPWAEPAWVQKAKYYLPPIQLHVLLAGAVVSLSLVALGLSIRAITEVGGDRRVDEEWHETYQSPTGEVTSTEGHARKIERPGEAGGTYYDPASGGDVSGDFGGVEREQARADARQARQELNQDLARDLGSEYSVRSAPEPTAGLGPGSVVRGVTATPGGTTVVHDRTTVSTPVLPAHPTYAGRWWLLAALVGLGTAALGVWLARWYRADIWPTIVKETWPFKDHQRTFAHTVGGSSIIVLSLILAILTRVSRRAKVTLSIFSVLLLASIASQVWGGILLMYDTSHGPITGFNSAGTTVNAAAPAAVVPAAVAPIPRTPAARGILADPPAGSGAGTGADAGAGTGAGSHGDATPARLAAGRPLCVLPDLS